LGGEVVGYDITYHPISEKEIEEWYFDIFLNKEKIDTLAKEYNMDDFYKNKYTNCIMAGLQVDDRKIFDKTHGFYIAIVQGFFRKFFYTRGSAFSFLIEENNDFIKYTKKWEDIISRKIKNKTNNRITENYCSGIYIPFEGVVKLLEDYNTKDKIKDSLNSYYSHNRINVFIKALEYSKNNKLGLLEATEAVKPNPNDLNKSTGYTNFWNCDHDGPELYQEAVAEQLDEIKKKIERE
jgi:hypothetical protein